MVGNAYTNKHYICEFVFFHGITVSMNFFLDNAGVIEAGYNSDTVTNTSASSMYPADVLAGI